jgi:hypothetical protein
MPSRIGKGAVTRVLRELPAAKVSGKKPLRVRIPTEKEKGDCSRQSPSGKLRFDSSPKARCVCILPTVLPARQAAAHIPENYRVYLSAQNEGKNMSSLGEMVGQEIVALVPVIDKVKLQKLKLHGVEVGGIWVESQTMSELLMETAGVTMSPKTVLFFLPFSQVVFVMASLDAPALSEKLRK